MISPPPHPLWAEVSPAARSNVERVKVIIVVVLDILGGEGGGEWEKKVMMAGRMRMCTTIQYEEKSNFPTSLTYISTASPLLPQLVDTRTLPP